MLNVKIVSTDIWKMRVYLKAHYLLFPQTILKGQLILHGLFNSSVLNVVSKFESFKKISSNYISSLGWKYLEQISYDNKEVFRT